MKKAVIPIMLCLLLLTGCADKAMSSFLSFRESVMNAQEISFTADVRAEYSDKTASFRLLCSHDAGGTTVEIAEPEFIRGIKAHTDGDGLSLEYDGAILDIGRLTDRDLSPMSAMPLLIRALSDAHPELAWDESGMTAVRLVPEDDLVITLWLNERSEPETAEITYKEHTVIFIGISEWKAE